MLNELYKELIMFARLVYRNNKKNYYNALENFHKSIDIHNKFPEHYKIKGYILTMIAQTHLSMASYRLSLKYLKQIEKDTTLNIPKIL